MIWHVLGLFAIIVIYNVARYFLLDDGDDKSPKREPEPKNNEENVTIMRWQGTDITCPQVFGVRVILGSEPFYVSYRQSEF